MARSTLFFPVLACLMRSVGAFPIQREGIGASGMKETLRRLRAGGIVTLFPEGTRSPDGELGPLKPGIAVLVDPGGRPRRPGRARGTVRSLAPHPALSARSSGPHPFWGCDLPGGALRHGDARPSPP